MADVREAILARMLEISGGLQGIIEAARNRIDATGLKRPAIAIQDGSEQLLSKPHGENLSRVQQMEMSPLVTVFVQAAPGNVGSLLNLFRARLLKSIIQDAELQELVGNTGEIRFEGCSFEEPTPETREGRMTINLVFVYCFRVGDL